MKNLLIVCVALLTSCTKEVKYSKEELYSLAKAADSSTTFIIPKSISQGVHCSDYPEGCLSAHIVQVSRLDLIAVEFATEDQAIYAAKKLRGYYIRNWLLDDVTGEPVLENFAGNLLKAKKP